MKFPFRSFVFTLSLGLAVAWWWARQSTQEIRVFGGSAFGSTYQVKYRGNQKNQTPLALKAEVEDLIRRYDQEFSLWKEDSFLSQWNHSAETKPVSISDWAVELISESKRICLESERAFDPTLEPLVQLWGFSKKRNPRIPSDQEIEKVLELVNCNLIEVDKTKKTLRKLHPKVQLNFNSVAPGHVADLIGRLFRERGIRNALIEVGGELLALGERKPGEAWVVGIEKPSLQSGEGILMQVLLRGAIATSGSYRNFKKIGSQVISHTLDPRTGKQVTHDKVSVSVEAPSALEADAWATALMVTGRPHHQVRHYFW